MLELTLKTELEAPTNVNPKRLFIYAHTKVGKTELASKLDKHILIDLEDGSEFVTANKYNITKITEEYNSKNKDKLSKLDVLYNLAKTIKAKNEEKGGYVYKYGIIDTATALEDIAKELGLKLYLSTPMGKNFKGNDILTLPNGAGYYWLRKGFETIYNEFNGLFEECLILLGHVKNAAINKAGKELSARDINLTGKLKQIVSADADAIGYLYRDKDGNKNILSFKSSTHDIATGARPPHLRNQEFVISELNEDNTVTAYWEKVFLTQ
jgi:hypothetical protein